MPFKHNILKDATAAVTTGAEFSLSDRKPPYSIQASIEGTGGTVTATVTILVSDDGVQWITKYTISLSGTTTATDEFGVYGTYDKIKASLTAIGGTATGKKVNVTVVSA